jgi:signal transduction histidine kinase
MKLSWKIFFSTLVISVLTFSAGGYLLISSIFRSTLDREIATAREENKMLRSYLGAVIPTVSSGEPDTIRTASESMTGHFSNEKLMIRISDASYEVIAETEEAVNSGEDTREEAGPQAEPDLSNRADPESQEQEKEQGTGKGQGKEQADLRKQGKEDTLLYVIVRSSDRYYVQTASALPTFDGIVYLETFHDISSLFQDRQNSFLLYQRLLVLMLALNGFLVFLMTLWATAPVKRLSNTTREIAKGKYGDRAVVRTKDEIGLLAEDFNKMADSLERKIRDLEETAVSQRDFIGSFAHELKTPLTSIIGYADMLRSKKMSEENRILAADYIFHEGKRLEALSLKLLDLLVVKNHDFEKKPVNMKELFQNIEGVMAPVFAGGHIVLRVMAEDTEIRVEPDLIKTLILNLLDNARKAISGNGNITLAGKRISEDSFEITVEDDGKGIPEKELSRITEVFYTVDKSRSRKEGVGIGLALCKEIAELHGGGMKFESRLGMGTRVRVCLREGKS